MSSRSIIGIILLVVGILVFSVGLNASNSMTDQVSNVLTGRFTENTTWYMIGGIAVALAGLLMLVSGFRSHRS
jgi:uncharacterized membrane protein